MTPKIDHKEVYKLIAHIDREKYPVVLLGIRGYFSKENLRGKYDDLIVWITPNGITSFQANTDPSAYRKGKGTGSGKGMATLNVGTHLYQKGIHNGSVPHPAFRQAEKVTVIRDGIDGNYKDFGYFGINIHRGGNSGTSSLGCQTIPPKQWDAFKELGYLELSRNNQKAFPYVLCNK